MEAAPQTFKLRMVDASTDATGVNEPTIGIVVAEEADGVLLRCSDGVGPPEFEDLVFRLSVKECDA